MDNTVLVPASQFTHFAYDPNFAANALYIAIFVVCFIGQLVQGVRYQTWQFMGPMLVGLLFELMGYTSRILMHQDPTDRRWFLLDNITLVLGPAFLAASIYLCMGNLVRLYGAHISAIRPRTYFIFFVTCDLLNLILQGVGGAISSTLEDPAGIQAGLNVIIAGLATQVASLLLFIACCTHFGISVVRHSDKQWQRYHDVTESKTFRMFLVGVGMATILIFIRSVFRMIELSEGFMGFLANNEICFMVLEGAMILMTTIILTVFHPGRCFRGCWQLPLGSSVMEVIEPDLETVRLADKRHESSVYVESCPPT